MEEMKIKSFTVDHDLIREGIYVSSVIGDITTYDMRTRIPNAGDYMDNLTMHSFEHMFATYIRFGEDGDKIIYFGPMGCQTGFYLLTRGLTNERVLELVNISLQKIIDHEGEVFGKSRKECGNYKNLDLESAKKEARRYQKVLNGENISFKYPSENT